jgi:hypothetical protein
MAVLAMHQLCFGWHVQDVFESLPVLVTVLAVAKGMLKHGSRQPCTTSAKGDLAKDAICYAGLLKGIIGDMVLKGIIGDNTYISLH